MKKFFILTISILFATNIYANESSDMAVNNDKPDLSPFTIGLMAYGYMSTPPDREFIGDGGGAGITFKYNMNKYFALGGLANITASSNGSNSTIFNELRFMVIFQRETERLKNGFVPWGAFSVGALWGNGDYENHTIKYENITGYEISFSLGLRYNYKKAFFGIGADLTYGDAIAELRAEYIYPNQNIYFIGTNIFLEAGYRF